MYVENSSKVVPISSPPPEEPVIIDCINPCIYPSICTLATYMYIDPVGVLPASIHGVQRCSPVVGQSADSAVLPHSVEGGGRSVEGML